MYGIQSPSLSPFEGFSYLFHDMGKRWENTWLSHMMKYTIGLESMEKHLYYGNCIGTNFTGFPYSWDFGAFSLYVNAMRKLLHFPFDELYHRMGTGWIRSTYTVGKLWLPISQVPPIEWVFLHFPCYGKSMGKPMHFSYGEIYHRMGTGWEKSTHTMAKV